MESGTNGGAPSCVKPFPASRFSVMSIYPSKRGTSSLIVPPDDTAASEKNSTRTGSARRKIRRRLRGIMKVKLPKTQTSPHLFGFLCTVLCAVCLDIGHCALCLSITIYNSSNTLYNHAHVATEKHKDYRNDSGV